jgi:GH18 family chitinase
MRQKLSILLPGLLIAYARAEFIVAGYYPDYRSYVNVNNTATQLTDLILFSIEPNGVLEANPVEGQCCLGESHFKLAREARTHRNHFIRTPLKLWVSIGGAGRSSGFKNLVSTESKQVSFARNLVDLCKAEHFDGIDLDWEGIDNQNDFNLYMDFIVLAAKALHDEELLLSITTRHRHPPFVLHHVDRINFMAYDLLLPNGPKHHASYSVVTKLVDEWLAAGYPPGKIVLGIPGYGRHKGNPSQVMTYAELVDDGLDDVSLSEWKGILFDSTRRIRKKMAYVKKKGLGGVFLWELGHDKQLHSTHGGVLLEAISEIQEVKDEL